MGLLSFLEIKNKTKQDERHSSLNVFPSLIFSQRADRSVWFGKVPDRQAVSTDIILDYSGGGG